MTSLMWKELSTKDFSKLDKDATLVILPIGSMEQHGPHLPVGTDTYGVEAVIEGISEKDLDVDLVILHQSGAVKAMNISASRGPSSSHEKPSPA